MEILFENQLTVKPKISFVLLDWSCRESFHTLQYLNQQSVPRDNYEIIWIEYYNRRSPEIRESLEDCTRQSKPPIVDQWIVMDLPEDIYYHKHLMYNVGILAACGRIVTLCDSDAMAQATFTESIIDSFDPSKNPGSQNPGIVLHHDEVRNIDKRHYPFDNLTFDEFLSGTCINWQNGTTTGLLDKQDPLHTRNYGASMSALRQDLISIGGADEYIDYLGHICGPYEMTFRLVNTGKKEVWHPREFLYHTWHPGTDGKNNHLGPHDGLNISSTALATQITKRLLPLQENPAIQTLRLTGGSSDDQHLIQQALNIDFSRWDLKSLNNTTQKRTVSLSKLKSILAQLMERAAPSIKKHKSLKGLLRAIFYTSFLYAKNLFNQNTQAQVNCKIFLDNLTAENFNDFAVLGTGEIAEHLYTLSKRSPLQIKGIYDTSPRGSFYDLKISPVEELGGYSGKVVLGTQVDKENRVNLLKNLGVPLNHIVILM